MQRTTSSFWCRSLYATIPANSSMGGARCPVAMSCCLLDGPIFCFGATDYAADLMVTSASTMLAGLSKGDSKVGEVISITFNGKAPMSNKRHTNKLKASQREIRKLLMQKVPETYKWLLQSELDQVATGMTHPS